MKRSEIKPGDELYYDRSTDWATGGYSGGRKAVVVSTERYKVINTAWGFHKTERYVQDPKGTAVLVDLHNVTDRDPIRRAVPLAHLRGPWDETVTAVEKAKQQKLDADNAKSKQRADAWAAASELVDRAKEAGVVAVMRRAGDSDGMPVIQLDPDEFARLLDGYSPK